MEVDGSSHADAAQLRRKQLRLEQPEGWPLLQLPAPAAAAVIAQLPPYALEDLRLASHATLALVDAHTTDVRRRCTTGALTTPLALRYPGAAHLHLTCTDDWSSSPSTDEEAAHIAGAQLCTGSLQQPWRSVTSLTFLGLPAAAVEIAIASCPNAADCCLENPHLAPGAPYDQLEQHMRLSTRHICGGQLPNLHTLRVRDCPLTHDDVLAVAGCRTLQNLEMMLAPSCSAAAREALLGLQLQQLYMWYAEDVVPTAVELAALQQMTSLTSLQLGGADLGPLWSLVSSLPSSLQSLQVWGSQEQDEHATVPHMQPELLATVVTACPGLAQLSLPMLSISRECHAAPLTALTQLSVRAHLVASEGARLSVICPALQDLSLECESDLADGAALLVNLTSLEFLCLGDVRSNTTAGLDLDNGTSKRVLAALPKLTRLQCLGLHDHINGVGALGQLQELEITFNPTLCINADFSIDPMRLCYALRTAQFPPAVTRACFKFMSGGQPEDMERLYYLSVVRAAPMFLVRAPDVSTICWSAGPERTDITDDGLWALASIPNVRQITVEGWRGHGIASAMLRHVRAAYAGRPLVVDVDEEYSDEGGQDGMD